MLVYTSPVTILINKYTPILLSNKHILFDSSFIHAHLHKVHPKHLLLALTLSTTMVYLHRICTFITQAFSIDSTTVQRILQQNSKDIVSYNFLKFSRIFTLCYIHNTQLFWLSFVFLQCFHVCWVQMWWDNELVACKLL